MNMNPYLLERMAEYERDRIQRDMKQIRLEKQAMQVHHLEEKTNKASFSRSSVLMWIVSTFVKLLQAYTEDLKI